MVKHTSTGLTKGLIAAAIFTMWLYKPISCIGTEKVQHPELSEQEKLVACADCHRESTPEVEKEWYDSVHGIAMVKCYQCHGTFETFRVTPPKADCATCHTDMLRKCPKEKECWECHVPHTFKVKK